MTNTSEVGPDDLCILHTTADKKSNTTRCTFLLDMVKALPDHAQDMHRALILLWTQPAEILVEYENSTEVGFSIGWPVGHMHDDWHTLQYNSHCVSDIHDTHMPCMHIQSCALPTVSTVNQYERFEQTSSMHALGWHNICTCAELDSKLFKTHPCKIPYHFHSHRINGCELVSSGLGRLTRAWAGVPCARHNL